MIHQRLKWLTVLHNVFDKRADRTSEWIDFYYPITTILHSKTTTLLTYYNYIRNS